MQKLLIVGALFALSLPSLASDSNADNAVGIAGIVLGAPVTSLPAILSFNCSETIFSSQPVMSSDRVLRQLQRDLNRARKDGNQFCTARRQTAIGRLKSVTLNIGAEHGKISWISIELLPGEGDTGNYNVNSRLYLVQLTEARYGSSQASSLQIGEMRRWDPKKYLNKWKLPNATITITDHPHYVLNMRLAETSSFSPGAARQQPSLPPKPKLLNARPHCANSSSDRENAPNIIYSRRARAYVDLGLEEEGCRKDMKA